VSAGTARRLAWANVGAAVLMAVVLLTFSVLNRDNPDVPTTSGLAFNIFALIPGLALPIVGALIVTRQPRQPIGWIFCVSGFLLPLSGTTEGYATYALLTNPGSLPGGAVVASISVWVFVPALVLLGPVFFMLFPDGRPLTPRWRFVLWVALFGLAAVAVGQWFRPGSLQTAPFESVANPLGIPGAARFLDSLTTVGFWAILVSVLGAAVSIVKRFRRSRGVTRLQLKWLALTGVAFALSMLGSSVMFQLGYEDASNVPVLVALGSIPIFAGQAMLRHNLYEIDVVINRTLVYGLLTAMLGAIYVGSVLLLQLALDGVTSDSSLAVAVSTLGVAALFRPARARIQAVVDRRFYRQKYDAARTLEGFSARLREQVDLEALAGELRSVVGETMQPAHVSLWLRKVG
jgi:hypothetical protein